MKRHKLELLIEIINSLQQKKVLQLNSQVIKVNESKFCEDKPIAYAKVQHKAVICGFYVYKSI